MGSRTMLLLAVVMLMLVGCVPASNSYVAAHRNLFNAKTPYLNAYAAEHPEVAPAIADNIAAEDALIRSAEAK